MTFDSTILVYLLGIPVAIAYFAWSFPGAFPGIIEPALTLLMKWTFCANFIGGTAMVATYNLAFRAYIDPKKLADADNKLLELQLYFFVALTFPLLVFLFTIGLGKLARHKIELDAAAAQPSSPP